MRLNPALDKPVAHCCDCGGTCRPTSARCHSCSISTRHVRAVGDVATELQRPYANGERQDFEARVRRLLSRPSY